MKGVKNLPEKLILSTLGYFSIKRIDENNTVFIPSEIPVGKVRLFLEYILINHGKKMSSGEIIDTIWPEGLVSSPENSLKSIVFKARKIIALLGYKSPKQVLISNNGCYFINSNIEVTCDCNQFENIIKKIRTDVSKETKDKLYKEAISLYKGTFLKDSAFLPWVEARSIYLKTEYITICCEYINSCISQGQFNKATEICKDALSTEPYEEKLHCLMLDCLAHQGYIKKMSQYYRYSIKLISDYYGELPSDIIERKYNSLISDFDTSSDLALPKETEIKKGALYCEYSVFKNIFELYCRRSMRTGLPSSVIDIYTGYLDNNICEKIKYAVLSSLRCDDVFTVSENSRFLILLCNAEEKNCEIIKSRIKKALSGFSETEKLPIQFSLIPLLT